MQAGAGGATPNSTGTKYSEVGSGRDKERIVRSLLAPPGHGTYSATEAIGEPQFPSTWLADQVLPTS